jgi:hypothetical protein
MTLLVACLGGLVGAGAVEVSELYSATRFTKDLPWRQRGELPLGPYLFTVGLRLALGAVAALVCAASGPLGITGAVAAGIAAPKLLEQLGRHVSAVGGTLQGSLQEEAEGVSPKQQSAVPLPNGEIPAARREGGPVDAPR